MESTDNIDSADCMESTYSKFIRAHRTSQGTYLDNFGNVTTSIFTKNTKSKCIWTPPIRLNDLSLLSSKRNLPTLELKDREHVSTQIYAILSSQPLDHIEIECNGIRILKVSMLPLKYENWCYRFDHPITLPPDYHTLHVRCFPIVEYEICECELQLGEQEVGTDVQCIEYPVVETQLSRQYDLRKGETILNVSHAKGITSGFTFTLLEGTTLFDIKRITLKMTVCKNGKEFVEEQDLSHVFMTRHSIFIPMRSREYHPYYDDLGSKFVSSFLPDFSAMNKIELIVKTSTEMRIQVDSWRYNVIKSVKETSDHNKLFIMAPTFS